MCEMEQSMKLHSDFNACIQSLTLEQHAKDLHIYDFTFFLSAAAPFFHAGFFSRFQKTHN